MAVTERGADVLDDGGRSMGNEAPGGGLRDAAQSLAKRFAAPGPPAAGSAAAATGALAAGLLEWTAGISARRNPGGFRKRARSIASRAAVLLSALSAAAHSDAEAVRSWLEEQNCDTRRHPFDAATESVLEIGARCAQVATLAAEVAREGHALLRPDAVAALRLASSAAECALELAETNLRSTIDAEKVQDARRIMWRVQLLLRRAAPAMRQAEAT